MVKTDGEETKEELQEELKKIKEELELHKWGAGKTEKSLIALQKELIQNNKEKEALLQSIGEGVVAIDANGKIILINHAAEELLGISVEQAMGKSIFEVWRVLDEKGNLVPEAEQPIKIALKGTTTTTTTTEGPSYFYTKKDGSTFPVAISVAPVIVNNKIIGTINAFHDITHEREIDKAKTEFVSLASHQLRTPLTGINWLSEMLGNGDLGKINAKQKETIEVISRSAKQMTELIGSLLNVSRLELGTFSINPKPVELKKITDEILQELSQVIIKKEIKIKKDYPDKTLLMDADPILLKIVCQNLLSNAVNYALPKTVVRAKIAKDNNNLIYTVTNQGIGISKEEQPKIFTKLFRASNAQLFVTDGTGLGLYITKLIVDASGGKIWFDSELNKQTNFYLSLPLKGMAARSGGKVLEASSGKI